MDNSNKDWDVNLGIDFSLESFQDALNKAAMLPKGFGRSKKARFENPFVAFGISDELESLKHLSCYASRSTETVDQQECSWCRNKSGKRDERGNCATCGGPR